MAARKSPIASMAALRRLVPEILETINADPQLALRAAVNPLLALEELGYELTPKLRVEAERRIRFSSEARQELETLEREIFRHAGESFDLDSAEATQRVLFDKLRLQRPEAMIAVPERKTPVQRSSFLRDFKDPLEPLADRHPIMTPLLAYRRLDASEPRLAPRSLYERVRRGEVSLPVTRVRARLISDAERAQRRG